MVREYKDSGITWIGRIPQDWNTTKLGSLYTQRNEKVSDKDYAPLSVTMQGILPQLETAAKTDDGDNRKLVKKGDFAINSRSDRRGSCGISPYDGSVSLINTILKPRGEMNPNFYNWLFHTSPFADEFYKWGHGIVDDLWTTRWQEMKNISVVIPSLEEQQHIADYLDKKCAEIDGLIELQEQMTAQLTDYKQSVITEAVTKGLNPNVEFVPSGVDWIGDIPKGWKVGKVSYFYSVCLGKMLQPNSSSVEDTYENYYCAANVGQNNIKYEPLKQMWFSPTEKKQYEVKVGDLLVVEGGDVASCDIVKKDMGNVYFQNALHRVRSRHFDDVRILRYLLMTAKKIGHIELICNKATISHFTKEKFENVRIPLPPKEEQEVIVSYLDSKCSEIDKLIALKQQKIETLKEYKKSLIFECVTGKKEIN